MAKELSSREKEIFAAGLSLLKGGARRLYMASVAKGIGKRSSMMLFRELGWDRGVIRKGLKELESGIRCVDDFRRRGRKKMEALNPVLEKDIREIAEGKSQTDPTFRTTKLYRKITGAEVRRQLIEERGYQASAAPSERSLRRKLTQMGYHPRKVIKSRPIRRIAQTDEIFNEVHRINQQADETPTTVRVSIDTKAVVAIGDLSRGGKSRQGEQALDHDMEPEQNVTPFGIHRPDTSQTWLYFTTGNATSDFMADQLCTLWPELKKTILLWIPSLSTPITEAKTAQNERNGLNA